MPYGKKEMEIYGVGGGAAGEREGGGTNRASFSGASVCIFLKLNFIY